MNDIITLNKKQVILGKQQVHVLSDIHATGITIEPYRKLGKDNVPEAPHPGSDVGLHRHVNRQSAVKIWFEDEEENNAFLFPIDPTVTISGKNNIAKRSVLKNFGIDKSRGSIKELWSQDDYTIDITGMFMSEDGEYPYDDVLKLRNYCEARKPLCILSDVLMPFGIKRIVIESFSFPHTNGLCNQSYKIQATSDDDFELLIKA